MIRARPSARRDSQRGHNRMVCHRERREHAAKLWTAARMEAHRRDSRRSAAVAVKNPKPMFHSRRSQSCVKPQQSKGWRHACAALVPCRLDSLSITPHQPRTCQTTRHSPLAIPARAAYHRGVKVIILCLAAVVCSSFTGCASKKPKSRYRNYEGDNSPGIQMFEEKPGYPLNTR